MNNIDFKSFYIEFANQELNWLPMDTEFHYKDNLESNRHLLEKYKWLDKKITYKFNSLGFRCDEFTDEPTAMFLGCSNTIGIGLPVEETWASIVAKNLNLKCANLAIGGGSADTAFRMCLGYIDQVKPKIVIYNVPPVGRLELLGVNKFWESQIFLRDLDPKSDDKFLLRFAAYKSNELLNYKKNLYGIKFLCMERNIKFLHFENYLSHFSLRACQDKARDLSHYGTMHNAEFARHVLSKI